MQIHPETSQSISLSADFMPLIRLMSYSGLYIHENTRDFDIWRMLLSSVHLVLITFQYSCIAVNTLLSVDDVAELTSNFITLLFYTHSITKFVYVGLRHKKFIRTLKVWDRVNGHPEFVASSERYHHIALGKIRKLLILVAIATASSAIAWIAITFFGESRKLVHSMESNSTISIDVPRLPIYSYYPWDPGHGFLHGLTFLYQCYYIIFSMVHGNMCDVLFCSCLIFTCEQLQHLKNITKPLIQLSISMDSQSEADPTLSKSVKKFGEEHPEGDIAEDLSYIYNNAGDWALLKRRSFITLPGFGSKRNGLLFGEQDVHVRSAIKYWVEHHKQIVKLAEAIGETYGIALLLHMLTTTIQLTLLAYQATKITQIDVFALSVVGYLIYSLAQIFLLCIFGNRLMEQSSSVMDSVYSSQWYEGSEQAKSFVQIVCQQCQKALTISGAKFFTFSLDLFASVLGAVVTYFMVLIQLK